MHDSERKEGKTGREVADSAAHDFIGVNYCRLFAFNVCLGFSPSVVLGQTKVDASYSVTVGLNDISGGPSATTLDHLTENDASEMKPDVNREHDLVLIEDFEGSISPGISFIEGETITCEAGNCFVKHVATGGRRGQAPNLMFGRKLSEKYIYKIRFNVRSGDMGPAVSFRDPSEGRFL